METSAENVTLHLPWEVADRDASMTVASGDMAQWIVEQALVCMDEGL